MSTQGRTSDQTEQMPQSVATTTTPTTGEGANLLHRWVRLVQQSALWGNDAGQVRLDELAQGPTTPRIQTLEEIRAARAAAVAQEEAAGGGTTSWWEDAICADDERERGEEICETETVPAFEEAPVCELDEVAGEVGERASEDRDQALEPQLGELPPNFTLPPLVMPPTTAPPIPPGLPAAGEGVLARVLAFGARRLLPVLVGLLPKDTAPPELTDRPYTGPEGGLEPAGEELLKDDNKCRAEKVKHRGGEEIHDQCADSIPGNLAAGSDWRVTTPEGAKKDFDAYTPGSNTVWEVKTMRMADYDPWVHDAQIAKDVAHAVRDNKIAERCGYDFAWQVSDLDHYLSLEPVLTSLGIAVTFEPECLRVQEE